jgi:hypothetical protein
MSAPVNANPLDVDGAVEVVAAAVVVAGPSAGATAGVVGVIPVVGGVQPV